ncbi:MAG TPA: OB-fold nucleic acid binding domain-containing protein, partial [Acidimicrobiales bacterium]|nr:OB-fold nucleic acid binding domain-containing protein [Acidimicrobiales bacterium]
PHANVTTVPFHFLSRKEARAAGEPVEVAAAALATSPNGRHPETEATRAAAVITAPAPVAAVPRANGTTPIGAVSWRQRVDIEGQVTTLRVQPLAGTATLELVVEDDSGTMSIVFLGRSRIPGIEVGTRLRAQGVAGDHRGRLAILNPAYQLLARR